MESTQGAFKGQGRRRRGAKRTASTFLNVVERFASPLPKTTAVHRSMIVSDIAGISRAMLEPDELRHRFWGLSWYQILTCARKGFRLFNGTVLPSATVIAREALPVVCENELDAAKKTDIESRFVPG